MREGMTTDPADMTAIEARTLIARRALSPGADEAYVDGTIENKPEWVRSGRRWRLDHERRLAFRTKQGTL